MRMSQYALFAADTFHASIAARHATRYAAMMPRRHADPYAEICCYARFMLRLLPLMLAIRDAAH